MANKGTVTLQGALHRAQIALDKMPANAVILDRYDHAWQHGGTAAMNAPSGYWYRAFGDDSEVSSFELAQRGPIKRMSVARQSPPPTRAAQPAPPTHMTATEAGDETTA